MKIVVVRSPKMFSGLLRRLFGIKKGKLHRVGYGVQRRCKTNAAPRQFTEYPAFAGAETCFSAEIRLY